MLFASFIPAPYPFGNLPLLVMTATKDPEAKSQAHTERWIAHYAELAKLSTAGRQMLVDLIQQVIDFGLGKAGHCLEGWVER